MIPDRIDRFVFLPYLQDLWKYCDELNGYWTYLEKEFGELYAEEGQPGEFYENEPLSFLYNFIINEKSIRETGELYNIDWPPSIEHCHRDEWVTVEVTYTTGDGQMATRIECMKFSEWEYKYLSSFEPGEEEIPTIEGSITNIDIETIQKRKDLFSDLIAFIEDDAFPFKQEYNRARKYTEMLNDKVNAKHDADDWFDDF